MTLTLERPTKSRKSQTRSINSTILPTIDLGKLPELQLFIDFCRESLILENGKPLIVEEYEAVFLSSMFSGVVETLILLPKKNGKTTILAALAIFHLCTTRDAECVIAAASRDQAAVLLKQAQGFIKRSPGLLARLDVKQRNITHRMLGGVIRILASDADTADGVIPTLALVDELHRHKSPEMYGIFRDGLGPRNGKMLTISTAGSHPETPLGQMHKAARKLPSYTESGAYKSALSDGHEFALHEWSLNPKDDVEDMAVVKTANPASWQTEEALAVRHNSPSMKAWQWARFACNIWVSGEDAAVNPKDWADCKHGKIPRGETISAGLDLGWKWDTTALVPLWMPEKTRRVFGVPKIIVPPRDGTNTDPEKVKKAIIDLHKRNPISQLVFDPNTGGEQMAIWVEQELGIEVVSHSQQNVPMSLAYDRFMEALREGWIEHPFDEEFTTHVLNASARIGTDGRAKFDRPSSSRNAAQQDRRVIDALIAAAMVNAVAGAVAPKQKSRKAIYL